MSRAWKTTALTLIVLFALGGTAMGAAIQLRQQDRLQDGSCQVAAIQLRQQDRLQDGSCTQSGSQLQERLRDGSCTVG